MISSQSERGDSGAPSSNVELSQNPTAEIDSPPAAENRAQDKHADGAAKKVNTARKSRASVGRKSSNDRKSGSMSPQNVAIATIPGGDEDHGADEAEGTDVAIVAIHRGIGDNSRHADTVVEDDTNSDAERAAVQAIAAFNTAMVGAANNLRQYTCNGLASLYPVVHPILTEGRYEAFCEAHQISVHGNSDNKCQPVVAHYFHRYHQPHVRQIVSRWAMIFAVAISDGIKPAQFRDWLGHRGLEKIVVRYKKLKNPNRAKAKPIDYEALARLALADPSTVPVVKGTPVTAGHTGLRLAVVFLDDSGSGDYKALAVLPHETDEVLQIVGEVVLKKLKSTK